MSTLASPRRGPAADVAAPAAEAGALQRAATEQDAECASPFFERTASGNFKPLYGPQEPADSLPSSSMALASLMGARMHASTATSVPLSPSKILRSRPSLLPAAPGSDGILLDFTRTSSLPGLTRSHSQPDMDAGPRAADMFARATSLDELSATDTEGAAATFEELQSFSSPELWEADGDAAVHGHAQKATRPEKVSFRKMLLKKLRVGAGRNSTF